MQLPAPVLLTHGYSFPQVLVTQLLSPETWADAEAHPVILHTPAGCEAAYRSRGKVPVSPHCDCIVQPWTISCLASCLHRHADGRTDRQIARLDGAAFWLPGRAQTPQGTAAVCTSVLWTWEWKSDETQHKQQPARAQCCHSLSDTHSH